MSIKNSMLRIGYLILKDFRQKSQIYFLVFIAVFGVMLLSYYNSGFSPLRDFFAIFLESSGFQLNTLSFNPQKFHLDWFPQSFYLLGLVYTSISFYELSESESRIFHLMLPSSNFEKWASKLIISAIIFPTLFISFYMIFQWISLRWGGVHERAILRIDDPYLWKFLMPYLSIQCFFLLGSVYFKKYAFIKSLATMIFSILGVLAIRNFALAIILGDFEAIDITSFTTVNVFLDGQPQSYSKSFQDFLASARLLPNYTTLIWIVSVYALILSFVKFRELEA